MKSQLQAGGEYDGFRLAVLPEVQALIRHAGSDWGICYGCPGEIPPMEDLITLIGSGYSFGTGISTWGYTLSDGPSTFFNGVLLSVDYGAEQKYANTSGGFKDSNPYGNLGGFLVREAQVAEPGTLALLGCSLLTVMTRRHRRYRIGSSRWLLPCIHDRIGLGITTTQTEYEAHLRCPPLSNRTNGPENGRYRHRVEVQCCLTQPAPPAPPGKNHPEVPAWLSRSLEHNRPRYRAIARE